MKFLNFTFDLDGWIKKIVANLFSEKLQKYLEIRLYDHDDEFGFVAKIFGLGISTVLIIIIIFKANDYADPRLLFRELNSIWMYLCGAIEEEAAYRFLPLVIALNRWSNMWKIIAVCFFFFSFVWFRACVYARFYYSVSYRNDVEFDICSDSRK